MKKEQTKLEKSKVEEPSMRRMTIQLESFDDMRLTNVYLKLREVVKQFRENLEQGPDKKTYVWLHTMEDGFTKQ